MLSITLIVFTYCLELLFFFYLFIIRFRILLFILLLVILQDLFTCWCCFVLILVKFNLTVNIGPEKCDFMWSIPTSTYNLVLIVRDKFVLEIIKMLY